MEKPPNICLLTETFHPVTGGGETQAKSIAAGLARMGSRVRVLTRRTDRALPRREPLGPVHVERLPPSGPGQLKKWGLVATVFLALLRSRRTYDVIVVCGFRVLGIPAVLASRLLDKPCVLKADTLGELSGEAYRSGLGRLRLRGSSRLFRFTLALRRRLLRRAAAFVAISDAVETELRAGGIEPERIHRIPNSVDTNLFSPAGEQTRRALREQLGIAGGGRVVVYTGRLERTKGLTVLLEAWRRVVEAHADAHLLLVGAGGLGIHNCEEELRAYVERHALSTTVTFTGSVDRVHEYLRAADVFVFPSRREAFGISVIEALACGLPVVTTAAGGLADIVRHGETGIVVPVDDVDALCAGIGRALRDEPGRIGAAGRELAVSRYSETQVLERYARLLAHCRGGSPRREDSG